MNTFQKKSIIIGLVMLSMVIFLVGYLQVILLTYTDYGLIKEFPGDGKIFEGMVLPVMDRKLVNMVRSDVIFPDDELQYYVKVNNPREHNAKIEYELEVFKGGQKLEPPISDEWHLESYSNELKTIKLFLKDEGSYDLKLNLTFYNETDNVKFSQYSSPKDKVEVLSHANKLQSDSNDLNFKGLLAASIIGGSTIIALVFSVYFSRKQVNEMKNENTALSKHADLLIDQITLLKNQNQNIREQFDSINRPWIILGRGKDIVYDNSVDLFLENIGNLPAQNIIIRYKPIFYKENDKKYIPEDYEKEIINVGIIMPKQKHHFTFNSMIIDNLMDCIECDVEIFVNYFFGNEEKISTFNYYVNNILSHNEITCKEAT